MALLQNDAAPFMAAQMQVASQPTLDFTFQISMNFRYGGNQRSMIEANKSFYSSLLWLCGLMFGVGHFFVLTAVKLAVWGNFIPYLVSFFILGGIYVKQARLKSNHERLFALYRRRGHIFADFLVASSLVSTFSVLTYLITNDNIRVITEYEIQVPQVILGINLFMYLGGLIILSLVARDERQNYEQAQVSQVEDRTAKRAK